MSAFDSAAAAVHASLLAVYGESFTITPAVGAAQTLTGVVSHGDRFESEVRGAKASVWARLADFTTAPLKGDTVTLGSVSYLIAADPVDHADQFGGVTLILRVKP